MRKGRFNKYLIEVFAGCSLTLIFTVFSIFLLGLFLINFRAHSESFLAIFCLVHENDLNGKSELVLLCFPESKVFG